MNTSLQNLPVNLQEIQEAHQRIKPYVLHTPVIPSNYLSALIDKPVFLKLECLQPTGSFKIRGATNRLLQLTPEERENGVIAVSSGNHGKAVAYIAAQLGIHATIFLSQQTPQNKVEAIHKMGATTIMSGNSYDAAEAACVVYEQQHNLVHIPSFDELQIIAGQGTIALEILESVPETRHIVFPLSGGGMASGLGIVAKNSKPQITLWGASMERAPVMVRSLEAGKALTLPEEPSLADGLKGGLGITNQYTFSLCQQLVDETVLVTEDEIGQAIAFLYKVHHLVVEGSGAVGVAALLAGKIKPTGPMTVVISGSNIDLPVLAEQLERYSGLF